MKSNKLVTSNKNRTKTYSHTNLKNLFDYRTECVLMISYATVWSPDYLKQCQV